MEDYKSSLPEAIRDDLRPLCDFLRSRQKEEHGRLVEALDGQRYRELVEQWRKFLDCPPPALEFAPKGETPVVKTSSRRIWRVYKRILKKGKAITDDSPVGALHSLRIECKKLRYLMEFFRSLYPPGEINKAIKYLRRLQDNLGDLNDFEVQQKTLKDFGQRMVEEEKAVAETLMAMGRLVERLEVGQREERRRFSKRFARFASPRSKKQFHELFSPETRLSG
jgi:CHAD domain-containing protein